MTTDDGKTLNVDFVNAKNEYINTVSFTYDKITKKITTTSFIRKGKQVGEVIDIEEFKIKNEETNGDRNKRIDKYWEDNPVKTD